MRVTTCASTPIYNIYDEDKEIIGRIIEKVVGNKKEYNRIKKEVEKEIALERKKISVSGPAIKYIDFRPPMTIVCFVDGTKTIVKAMEDDVFDPEKGAAMAIAKKYLGDKYNSTDIIKYYVDKYNKKYSNEEK